MRYTASAIGLLTRQYRSVLKKCFLINCGLFALGAIINSANAATLPTPTLGDNSAYEFITNGASETNYDVKVGSTYAIIGLKDIENYIDWTDKGSTSTGGYANSYVAGSNVTVNTDDRTIAGTIRMKLPHNGTIPTAWNRYFTYTYMSGYTPVTDDPYTVSTSTNGTNIILEVPTTDRSSNVITNAVDTEIGSITNKTYTNNILTADFKNHYNIIGGSAILNQGTIENAIVDFVGNKTTSSSTAGTKRYVMGTVANISVISDKVASINLIDGDFIGNSSSYSTNYSSSQLYSYGGAISNYANNSSTATISSILGNFVGNSSSSYSQNDAPYSYGGAISNYADNSGTATIGSIMGDFIGNSSSAITSGATSAAAMSFSYGGAISNCTDNSGTATIGSIMGDFIGNYTVAASLRTTSSYGGAIYNATKKAGANAEIHSVAGNFIGNTSSANAAGYSASKYFISMGGALSNSADNSGTATISSIAGDFIGNSSITSATSSSSTPKLYSFGGAVSNQAAYGSTATIGLIVGDFIGNSAINLTRASNVYGGAIFNGALDYNYGAGYSSGAIITLGGNTFTDNYTKRGTNSKEPNSIYNAGIINIADGATVTINDGWKSDSDGKLIMGSDSTLNMNIGNGTIQADSLGKINNDNGGTINATADIDVTNVNAPTSDTITVSSVTQSGVINLNSVNFIKGTAKATIDDVKDTPITARILINSDGANTLQLARGTDLANGIIQKGEEESHSIDFTGDAKWSNSFGSWTESVDWIGTAALATSDGGTTHDSITVTVTDTQKTVSPIVSDGDTLKIVNNNADHADKTFTADNDGDTYNVTDNLGATKGTLSVNGVADGEAETIDLKGFTGFELGDGATALNLNNVTVTDTDEGKTPANTTVATVTNSAAEINLNNATVDGGITNAGELNISGASAITGNITGTDDAVMNVNSDFTLGGNVTGHNINVNGATFDLGTNAVNVKSATLDGNSTLALRINSLANHGSLTADTIKITEGAKLKATLAHDADLGDVTLLTANVSHDGDFADEDVSHTEDGVTVEDNYMYKFLKKKGEFGVFTIAQKATAEEIAEAAGAEQWAAEAAGAYADSGAFDAGTVGADVANKLTDLAQNDPAGLVKAVNALAPTETAVVEENATENSSRLFKNVDAYLRGERDPMGFASGDELKGVSVWAKAYVGEAKINDRGKVAGSESDSRGVIMGVEKKLDNSKKVGVGFQYDDTDIDALSRDIDVATVNGFVYGEYKPSRWFINSVAAYGQSDYKEKKFALGSKYTADYDVHIASLAAMTGYQFKYFTPEAGMRYYHIKQDGYTDSAGQSVGAQNTDILRAVLGTRVAKDFGRIRPEAYFGVTYDLMAGEHDTTVNLANGASYTVPGKRLARLGYEASASLGATITDNITASLSYLGAYRRDYQEHTGMFNVKYNF